MREGYEDLKEFISNKTGNSINKTGKIMTGFSQVVKEAIKRGDTVEVVGLVKIYFTTTTGIIYKNNIYNLEDQLDDLEEELGLDRLEIKNVLVTYLKRIKERVLDGYQVNLKGICYLIPKKEEGIITCIPRVSPVLYKPELADFVITTEEGIYLQELTEDDLRFKIDIDEDIEIIYELAEESSEGFKLKEVNI